MDVKRHSLRRERTLLGPETARLAAAAITRRLWAMPLVREARRIGAYVAVDGEIDPASAIERLRSGGVHVFLPVATTGVAMMFAQWDGRRRLIPGRFGIPEPPAPPASLVDPYDLDAVLVPVVAVDRVGTRLGRGAGFYDRAFATSRRPYLIGLAHDFQVLDRIRRQPWDVALDRVVTPSWVLP